ncbi:MAG TPA: HDIG domain-containing protein [Clostridiaceae bacterium]|nr:HDIG domain-containing protein [Clostridiaceae bacterium]
MSKQTNQQMRKVKLGKSGTRDKTAQGKRIFSGILTGIVVYIAICFIVYKGSLPTTYNLKVNDISAYDIQAPRTFVDQKATEIRAKEVEDAVPKKMIKNDQTTAVSLANIESFIDLVNSRREQLYYRKDVKPTETKKTTTTTPKDPDASQTTIHEEDAADNEINVLQPSQAEIATAATPMLSEINQSFDINLDLSYAVRLLSMEESRFNYFSENLQNMSRSIMQQAMDSDQLLQNIQDHLYRNSENQDFFVSDNEILDYVLKNLLKPNVQYDKIGTDKAREDAANQVRNNPIMINAGARIVSQGDVITQDVYDILEELNLTDTGEFDWHKFSGIAMFNLFLLLILILYFKSFHANILFNGQTLWSLILSIFIPLIVAYYMADTYPLSPPIYFSTIIICAYFDLKTSIVVSTVLALGITPMSSFHPYFLPVSLVGCLAAAFFARKISRQDNYIKLISATMIASLSTVLALGIIQKDTIVILVNNAVTVTISSMISVIAAIGVMPIFEIIFNTVSPIKIIELSQPGHPLLKRLFTEAPGTSQHSMMVANLSDAGAEAIGADSTLARVGAYYHDIGKLENPLMFTENQMGENPHDRLTPEESCRIITAHTEDGLKLGQKHRLPEPVLKMIYEHHGTTVLQFFYHKASEIAELEGKEAPNKDAYRYHNPLPSFKESAVLMLADSVEAAMKSSQIDNVQEAEKFMRSIFKIKMDQNQLINSGLSFRDVELILEAFLQVYAGQFHSRIKYPETKETMSNE